MSFTASTIKTIAEAEIDYTLTNADVVQNINSCLIEFVEHFRKTATQTVTAVADTWNNRTSGHLAIVKVTADGDDYTGGFELSYDRSQILFDDAGTYVVTSLIIPGTLTDISDAVPVHDVFQAAIARYVGALFKLKDNDQNPDGLRMLAKAEAMIQQSSAKLFQSDKRTGIRIPIKRSAVEYRDTD